MLEQPVKEIMIDPITGVAYEIFPDELGEGGFGKIRRACRVSDEKELVVKIVSAENSELIEQEAKLLKKMFNTVALIQNGQNEKDKQDDNYYLFMDRVPGKPLSKKILDTIPLFRERVKLLFLLALDLNTWHNHKLSGNAIIHFDIKPVNAMVDADENGNVKDARFVDVGISFEIKATVNSAEARVNVEERLTTPFYVAPEVHNNNFAVMESDIRPFGALAYEVLGAVPLKGINTESVGADRVVEEYSSEDLYSGIEEIPEELKPVITAYLQKMTEFDYKKRPNSEAVLRFFTVLNNYCVPAAGGAERLEYLETLECMVTPAEFLKRQVLPKLPENKLLLLQYLSNNYEGNEKIFYMLAEAIAEEINSYNIQQIIEFLRVLEQYEEERPSLFPSSPKREVSFSRQMFERAKSYVWTEEVEVVKQPKTPIKDLRDNVIRTVALNTFSENLELFGYLVEEKIHSKYQDKCFALHKIISDNLKNLSEREELDFIGWSDQFHSGYVKAQDPNYLWKLFLKASKKENYAHCGDLWLKLALAFTSNFEGFDEKKKLRFVFMLSQHEESHQESVMVQNMKNNLVREFLPKEGETKLALFLFVSKTENHQDNKEKWNVLAAVIVQNIKDDPQAYSEFQKRDFVSALIKKDTSASRDVQWDLFLALSKEYKNNKVVWKKLAESIEKRLDTYDGKSCLIFLRELHDHGAKALEKKVAKRIANSLSDIKPDPTQFTFFTPEQKAIRKIEYGIGSRFALFTQRNLKATINADKDKVAELVGKIRVAPAA